MVQEWEVGQETVKILRDILDQNIQIRKFTVDNLKEAEELNYQVRSFIKEFRQFISNIKEDN